VVNRIYALVIFGFILFSFFIPNVFSKDKNWDYGVYEFPVKTSPPISRQKRQEVKEKINKNIEALIAKEKIQVDREVGTVLLAWPLKASFSYNVYGYHGVSNFVDHNLSVPDQLQDYNCGTRSYDISSGYNHEGTDFFLWPFPWNMMDNDLVHVVAAAPGIIVGKDNGEYDRNCSMGSSSWNAIYIQHNDGSTAWYGHFKNNSITSRNVGESVDEGEYLGIVGSSGSSTSPHLHFELYDSSDNLIDPYLGPCNNTITSSLWKNQKPYYDSAVNRLMTASAAPVFPSCPNPETENVENNFEPGDAAYFITFYRDQLSTQTSQYTVFQPDGSIFQNWSHNSDASHYEASWWYWWWTLPANAPEGLLKFRVIYNGSTYEHFFTVGVIPGDLNRDKVLDLKDCILGLQVISGDVPAETVFKSSDINNDWEIGLEEVIFGLRFITGNVQD